MRTRSALVLFWGAGLACFLAAGCSTEKDAWLNRTFHGLNARDNGWFNANEKLNEKVAEMQRAYVDDYDQVLPIYIYGTPEQSKAMVADMEVCIDKCTTVIDRHSMDIGGKEANHWIDDAFFVIGKSNFYKRNYFEAERSFDYVGRKYKGENRQLEAKLWSARTSIQLEHYAKAQSMLEEVRNVEALPKRFPHDELSALQAELDLKRGKVDDAIVSLERAVSIAEDRKERVRWAFILAQLYQVKGMEDKAIAQYRQVTHMNPPYEMGFHAQIFEALSFDRGSSEALRKRLKRMLRDDKHIDHFDMIHYALADLDLKENKDSSAIAELRTSCRVSTTDTRQKAKSFLKLADIYFDDREYPAAQLYYDSTQALLAEDHKRYEEVKTRAEVLGELVEQLNIIATEDSLQELAGLSEEEREKRIKAAIKKREREEEDKASKETEARDLAAAAPPPVTPKPGGGSSDKGAFYFYNPQQIARGTAEFKKKWGNRALEDGWRRKDKGGSAIVDAPEDGDPEKEGATAEKKEGDPPWKDPANYLKDVPLDEAAMEASDVKICAALYISGTIYKEKLRDVDNAIESFEVLNNRFEECRYTPESHYQLYRIYLEKEKKGNFFDMEGKGSAYYAAIIMERWPDSEFARLVQNPEMLMADEKHKQIEQAEYEQWYRTYRNGSFMPVIAGCNTVISTEPKNHLLPKYYLLKAMAVGGTHEMTAFRNALSEVVNRFAGTEEAKAAADILAALDKQAGGGKVSEATAEEETEGFMVEEGQHQVAIVFPRSAGSVDLAKAKLSDFSQSAMRNEKLNVNANLLDDDRQFIVVGMFTSKAKALEYLALYTSDRGKLKGLNDKGYAAFAISPANSALLFKSKDVEAYVSFFNANYLKEQ
jgi:tetratricopeptide (TPR) repeat protein